MQKLLLIIFGLYFNVLSLFSKKMAGKHAFFVFCYPFKIKLKKEQQAILDALEQFQISFEGNKIQGYKWGNGDKKVLCIHGWQSNAYRWKKFGEELSKFGFSVYAFDAPGHGSSEGKVLNIPLYAGAIKSVLDEIGGAQYMLTHSLGGLSAMHIMHSNTEYSPVKMAVMGIPGKTSDFVELYAELMHLSYRAKTALYDYFKIRIPYPIEHFSVYNYGPKLMSEGLIIHDSMDKEAPLHHALELGKLWENSQFIQTNGFGHKLRDISVVNHVVDFFKE